MFNSKQQIANSKQTAMPFYRSTSENYPAFRTAVRWVKYYKSLDPYAQGELEAMFRRELTANQCQNTRIELGNFHSVKGFCVGNENHRGLINAILDDLEG
jgi:hypothetical protein